MKNREYCRYCNAECTSGGACRSKADMKACPEFISLTAENRKFSEWDKGEHEGCGVDSQRAMKYAVSASPDGAGSSTVSILTNQALEQHEHIRLLEEWVAETISQWKRGDIKTAHIQRGQLLLQPESISVSSQQREVPHG